MNWQSPQYQEVKMDAEIGSYQPDAAGREAGGFRRGSAPRAILDEPI